MPPIRAAHKVRGARQFGALDDMHALSSIAARRVTARRAPQTLCKASVKVETGTGGKPAKDGGKASVKEIEKPVSNKQQQQQRDGKQSLSNKAATGTIDIRARKDKSERASTEEVKPMIAKISAAKKLANRLAEEKALATASMDGDEQTSTANKAKEQASAEAAADLARADAVARAMRMADPGIKSQARNFERLKAENEALYGLIQELAAENAATLQRLEVLRNKYEDLHVSSLQRAQQEAAAVAQDGSTAAPADTDASKAAEVVNIYTTLAVAREALKKQKAVDELALESADLEVVEDLVSEDLAAEPAVTEEPAVAVEAVVVEPEPPVVVEQPPPPPPPPVDMDALVRDALRAAIACGDNFCSVPAGPVTVGQTVRMLYNRSSGPLRSFSEITLKVGFNKWEEMAVYALKPLPQHLQQPGAEFWETELPIPDDVYKVDFVIMDASATVFDNNLGNDFHLALKDPPTEDEVLEMRAAAYMKAEAQRKMRVEASEDAIMAEAQRSAEMQAEYARKQFREDKAKEYELEAAKAVALRRGGIITSLPVANEIAGVFKWPEGQPRAGASAMLVYNRIHGPLMHSEGVIVHVGYDKWFMQEKAGYAMQRMPAEERAKYNLTGGEWWCTNVAVPASAAVVDFVFSDSKQRAWDNNGNKDFHTLVTGAVSAEELIEMARQRMQAAAAELDRAAEDAFAKQAFDKVMTQAKAARKRREKLSEFLFTSPLPPEAGQEVELYYNPSATVLRGRPDIWVRGSWNRWTHPQCFMPQKMQSTLRGGVGFYKANVKVPKDAVMMDLVFSDSGDLHGGFFDNNRGLDYHIPVKGGVGQLPQLHVVHVACEMAPIAKVGGMGDVVTALGRAVQDLGHRVTCILPKYDCINYDAVEDLRVTSDFHFNNVQVKVWQGIVEEIHTVFLEPQDGSFWKGYVYGRYQDDKVRFGNFCAQAAEYLRVSNLKPTVVHCHDWQTAPMAWMDCGGARSIFTIHNLNYGVDLIRNAMASANVATTVSPTYAAEISGHESISAFLPKLYGIRNGIDTEIWDPRSDKFLPRNYSAETVKEGKAAARQKLCERLNISNLDVPLVGVVTRLTHQKGIHLIKHAAWRTVERGGQFVLLGSAPDPAVQAEFNALAEQMKQRYHDRAALCFKFDEPLSHLYYAGCDILLVPSMFEPCGLTQMIAMRYGTVPVVRKTGGLNDTVFDVDHDAARAADAGIETNGYNFEGMDAAGIDYALNRALSAWYSDKVWWNALARRVMQQDWSWSDPALDYIELYYRAMKNI